MAARWALRSKDRWVNNRRPLSHVQRKVVVPDYRDCCINIALRKTPRVDGSQRIASHIRIGVDPTVEPIGIRRNVATTVAVVIPLVVVVEPGFCIEVLAGEAQL